MPPQTQNRKDILQAYRMMTQRTGLALIAGDPDAANRPLARRNMATITGILAGVITCGVFVVLGLIFHGGSVSGLTANGTLVIDKNTATSYVPCTIGAAKNQKKLCPALNYASALLSLETSSPNTQTVSQSSLAAYQIGPTIGIAGLPQDLPTSSDLVKDPWSVCVTPDGVSTLVGGTSVGGTALGASTATLVQSQKQDWVLWNGTRMKTDPTTMTRIWQGSSARQVPPGWLNTIPQGASDFTAPMKPGAQVHGPSGPAQAGQVYKVSGAGQAAQYYMLGQDAKLHSVTQMQAVLLEDQQGAPPERPLSGGLVNNTGTSVPGPGLPQTQPGLSSSSGGAMCVSYSSGTSHSIVTGATVPANAASTGSKVGSSTTVNRVSLPQGHGALIGVASSPGETTPNAWFLLVGSTRYGLTGPGVASFLGYDQKSDQTVLPASLVDVLPLGPALDPDTAKKPVSG